MDFSLSVKNLKTIGIGIDSSRAMKKSYKSYTIIYRNSERSTLKFEKNRSHFMFNETCYKANILPTYTETNFLYFSRWALRSGKRRWMRRTKSILTRWNSRHSLDITSSCNLYKNEKNKHFLFCVGMFSHHAVTQSKQT